MSLVKSVLLFITTSTENQALDSVMLRKKETQAYFLTYLNNLATKFTQKVQLFILQLLLETKRNNN